MRSDSACTARLPLGNLRPQGRFFGPGVGQFGLQIRDLPDQPHSPLTQFFALGAEQSQGLGQPFGALGGQSAPAFRPFGRSGRCPLLQAAGFQFGFGVRQMLRDALGARFGAGDPGGMLGNVRLILLARLPRGRHLIVGKAQVYDQQTAFNRPQPVFESQMLFRPLGLKPQWLDARDNLALDVANAQQIGLGRFQFPQGFALFDPVLFDPRRFFKQAAPVFGIDRQNSVNLPLVDQRIRLAPDAGI